MRNIALLAISVVLLQGCATSTEDELICGSVASYITPPVTDSLYRVVVTHLNGKPVISRPYYKLPAGEHQFTVAELIESPELKVKLAARQTKTILVEVEREQRYHLAAEFKLDKVYNGLNTDYWQPVVWKKESYECAFANPME
ncbi:hypothetical protein Q4601_17525 [Shewanella sp. 1_MG-2023]|uniref:Lipoprotein n=1 Tax=Shewanella electrodiphila TaxID=934143 RepID=A0ABT0KMB7_9GAMM|nr:MULTISPECIES: hypothetical protein [Shewanella]MCL1044681.1 hypothetical protein [Shewanella electrodiphila]MDO6613174.1 hypothetical protein [Shewanella sp. 7_MG-2023]MDO6773043.1 hypothetical protein [Shewanella sp. 2_MG-2023]MDO6796101.1 hypothetical protein [Shewanella sp. 1_MG-2023]